MPMEIFTKVSGRMIKPMGLVFSLTLTVLAMKVSGLRTCNMVKVLRHGTMDLHGTLVSSSRERSMVKADLNGKMVLIMKEISLMVSFKVLESTTLQI